MRLARLLASSGRDPAMPFDPIAPGFIHGPAKNFAKKLF